MTDVSSERATRVFAIVNPASGNAAPADVHAALTRHFAGDCPACDIHEVTPDDNLTELARQAAGRGHDVVVAAGGDGTVSFVANGLVGTEARLGIVPLGTTNVLARELGIPIDLDASCALLAGPNSTANIDAMRVGENHYFTQLGIGVDALMIRDTSTESKKRFGQLAYIAAAVTNLLGFRSPRFSIVADEQKARPRASQVLLANSGTLGTTALRWGPNIRVDDGRIDVCIVRARTLLGYAGLAWSMIRRKPHVDRKIDYLIAERKVAIHSDRPLPVQADGEIIGQTPVEVEVVPRALAVVVPARDRGDAG